MAEATIRVSRKMVAEALSTYWGVSLSPISDSPRMALEIAVEACGDVKAGMIYEAGDVTAELPEGYKRT